METSNQSLGIKVRSSFSLDYYYELAFNSETLCNIISLLIDIYLKWTTSICFTESFVGFVTPDEKIFCLLLSWVIPLLACWKRPGQPRHHLLGWSGKLPPCK